MKLTWSDIPDPVRQHLLKLKQTDNTQFQTAAATLKMNPQTLERRLREYRNSITIVEDAINGVNPFPPSPTRQYTDFLKIESDNFIVISDFETPDHNATYLYYALLSAISHGIKTLIIAGDLLAGDQEGISSWASVIQYGDELTYDSSRNILLRIIEIFAAWFDHIYIIEGNHDNRVARATKGQIHLGMLLGRFEDSPNIHYSRYGFMTVETSRGVVWVCHPTNFSGDPVVLGQHLYNSHWPKGHWIVPHCHRKQTGWSPDGQFEIHAIGTGRDRDRTKYAATQINKHKAWDYSFLMVEDGYFTDLDLRSTNWRTFLGEKYFSALSQAKSA